MIELLRRLEQRLMMRIANVFRRGELGMCNDQYAVQIFGYAGDEEGDDQEQFDGVELWQHYGLTSRPPSGSEVLCANLMGASENAIPFATNSHDDRPTGLADGEVVIYGKKTSGKQPLIRVKPSGDIEIIPAENKILALGGAVGDCSDFLSKGSANASQMQPVTDAEHAAITSLVATLVLLKETLNLLAGEPALSTPTKTKCTATATSCTATALLEQAVDTAKATFQSFAGGAGLSAAVKVK